MSDAAVLQQIIDAERAYNESEQREQRRREDWTAKQNRLLREHSVDELAEMGETRLSALKRRFLSEGIVGQCQRCNKPVQAKDSDGPKDVPALWTSHRDCEALFQEHERETRRMNTEKAVRDRFELDATGGSMALSAVPNWPWARFENAEFVRRASRRVLGAYKTYRPTQGNLIVSAPTGRGKTSGVVAWLFDAQKRAIDAVDHRLMPRFLFLTGPMLANARRRAPIGHEAPLVDLAARTGLLILDELGFESAEPTEEIFVVIDARYRAAQPTIITTARSVSWVNRHYGDAIFRRLIETGTFVEDNA
jgi:DNA replication protein DnaC